MARSRKAGDTHRPPIDPIGQAVSAPGASTDRARHLWARYEALPSYGLPNDVVAAAGEAITARAAFDAKGKTCSDDKGRSMLSVPKMRDAMRKLAACDGWQGMDTVDRALLDTLLEAAGIYPRLRLVTIGKAAFDGTWRQPPLPETGEDGPDSLAEVTADPAVAVAAGLLFRGRLGMLHGPSFGGKSTLLANAVARITTGRPWLDRPTVAGAVVLLAEEPMTYRHVIETTGGDVSRVRLAKWRNLRERIKTVGPVAVIVDTLQRVAHEQGGAGNMNDAADVDAILRPLEAIARDYDVAVIVTDHEPWEDGPAGATATKNRPRGSTAKPATADYVLRCQREGDDVTTVEPNPGAARWGIDVSAFRVDARGWTVIDRPTEVPPAVSGQSGVVAAETDDQPFAAVLADLSAHMREKWSAREPAIRAMLTDQPAASDRAVVKAVGLPTGGRNWRTALQYVAAVRVSMLADSVDSGSALPDSPPPTPEEAPEAPLPEDASENASTPLPIGRKRPGSVASENASDASDPYRGSAEREASREAPSGASGNGEPEASGSADQDAASAEKSKPSPPAAIPKDPETPPLAGPQCTRCRAAPVRDGDVYCSPCRAIVTGETIMSDDNRPAPRGRFAGILPAAPRDAGDECPRCGLDDQAATCTCRPLAVYIDKDRRLSDADSDRAAEFMRRLRERAGGTVH